MKAKKMNLDDFIVNIFYDTDNFMNKFFQKRTLRTRRQQRYGRPGKAKRKQQGYYFGPFICKHSPYL
jgi:hypothetical protein